ncbi:MAG: hypothetical protein WAN35_04035 [Terracidiphilus sp.]
MRAMILHAASIAAFYVDQLAQAPVQIQCVQQTAPESWLKELLPTIVQTVVSLLSIFAGVGIAVRSFRANKKSEHEQWIRNQKAGHEQWILDQRKSEWKELLMTVSGIETVIPAVSKIQDRYDSVSKCLPQRIAQLLAVRAGSVFLSDILYRQECVDAFTEFINKSAVAVERLQDFDAQREVDPGVRQLCQTDFENIRIAYLKFCNWIRIEAQKDLGAK